MEMLTGQQDTWSVKSYFEQHDVIAISWTGEMLMLAFLHSSSHPFPLEIVSAENHAHRFSEWTINVEISKSGCVKCNFQKKEKVK